MWQCGWCANVLFNCENFDVVDIHWCHNRHDIEECIFASAIEEHRIFFPFCTELGKCSTTHHTPRGRHIEGFGSLYHNLWVISGVLSTCFKSNPSYASVCGYVKHWRVNVCHIVWIRVQINSSACGICVARTPTCLFKIFVFGVNPRVFKLVFNYVCLCVGGSFASWSHLCEVFKHYLLFFSIRICSLINCC